MPNAEQNPFLLICILAETKELKSSLTAWDFIIASTPTTINQRWKLKLRVAVMNRLASTNNNSQLTCKFQADDFAFEIRINKFHTAKGGILDLAGNDMSKWIDGVRVCEGAGGGGGEK